MGLEDRKSRQKIRISPNNLHKKWNKINMHFKKTCKDILSFQKIYQKKQATICSSKLKACLNLLRGHLCLGILPKSRTNWMRKLSNFKVGLLTSWERYSLSKIKLLNRFLIWFKRWCQTLMSEFMDHMQLSSVSIGLTSTWCWSPLIVSIWLQ